MIEELRSYILIIVFAGVLSLIICLFSYLKLKDSPGARHYIIVTFLSAIFTFSYAFELSSSTLQEINFWLGIEYFVMPFIPAFTLLMCFEYVGVKLKQKFYYALFGIPLITVFTHHTNELHHLYYVSVRLRTDTPFPIADMEYGPFFYVHSLYLFICLSISMIILLLQLKKSLFRFKLQILTMVAGLFVPIAANHFYLNDLSPFGIDLGPVSMSLSFILHGIALFTFQMFNVLPIAREKVFESMNEGVIVLDQNGTIVDYNKSIQKVMPMLNTFSLGKPIGMVLNEDEKLRELIILGMDCDYECVKGTQIAHYQVRFSQVVNGNGTNIGTIITFVNITERVELQEKLKQLASYDGLTKIYNRTYFLEQSNRKLDSKGRKERNACLVLFDIDHFKKINDTYGHETGDLVLSHIAELVKDCLRPQDLIGRYGGEEFIVLLFDMNVDEAFEITNTIRIKISESFIRNHDFYNVSVTASFGVAQVQVTLANQQEAIKLAIRNADEALYEAKRDGRNRVQVFKENMQFK
ncbi:diguanylate cyclase [Lysinibacillus composti]|uniref:Diguanylate cyclase n=1 Tax=Lysinibacillus composti TaxID=720633 RepID=A0A3N9UUA5_9BACI|nr:diguanylate cyclase [Lysinibacillus composti]